MGLLDEAIREHLELKRRSGADPSAVAREEREALAPVFPEEHADPDDDGEPAQEESDVAAKATPADSARVDGHDREYAPPLDPPATAQETAELDMQSLMEEDPDAADGGSPLAPLIDGPSRAGYSGETSGPDPLEWEVPSERDDQSVPDDVPGQERLSFE